MSSANWKYHRDDSIPEALEAFGLGEGYESGWFGPGTPPDLTKAWKNKEGIFLFLKTTYPTVTAEAAAFKSGLEGRLRKLLGDYTLSQLRFLWVENPMDDVIHWRFNAITIEEGGNGPQVSRLTYLDMKNYSFSFAKGTTISYNPTDKKFALENTAPHGMNLISGYGDHFFEVSSQVHIPLNGTSVGCLQFGLSISKVTKEVVVLDDQGNEENKEIFGYPALKQLDIGIRMFFRDPEFPTRPEDNFFLASHRYPFLQETFDYQKADDFFPVQISWKVSLDLLYPLSRERCYFEFDSPVTDNPDTGLPSAFRTHRGYSAHLLPQDGESLLYFTPRPATLQEEALPNAPLYLTPAGKFLIKVPKYEAGDEIAYVKEANVICGLSGLEYIKVRHDINSFLILKPDQPAFAPSFLSAFALLRDLKNIIAPKINETAARDNFQKLDTIDLDMPIEETYSLGLGIDDEEREDILDYVRVAYFPTGYEFTDAARSAFMSLEIVEELVNWLRIMLQTSAITGKGQDSLVSYISSMDGLRFPTTSWVYFDETNGVNYYTQPDQAVLYKAEASSTAFLDYMEVPALGLPQVSAFTVDKLLDDATIPAFPMLPYGNVDTQRLTDMLQLENLLVNNLRYGLIRDISLGGSTINTLKGLPTGPMIGTTPQGLIATYTPNASLLKIESLQLAKDWKGKEVKMVNIPHTSRFKSVLQSNQLFMVIDNPETIQDYFSTTILNAATGGGINQVDIENWLFELGPGHTDNDDDPSHWDKKGTILVFKFHDKPLMEMATKPEQWALGDHFTYNKEMASLALQDLINDALESGTSKDPKERKKYAAIMPALTQANWTGILAFNIDVPLRNLPEELMALAGGMDPNLFYSQYLGIEITPVESSGEVLQPKPSSFFALIDYQNNVVQEADDSGYNFHVPYLTVIFRNSLITDFSAEVQLFMDYLFHEEAYLVGSTQNMINLKGVAERHNGKTTYSFGFSGANKFELSGKVLKEVEIVKAQFATDPLPNPKPEPLSVTGRFSLWGRIRFVHLEKFDVLSFGAEDEPADPPEPDFLNMNNMQITMGFKLHKETATEPSRVTDKEFNFIPQQMAFDLKRSGWRKQSLYEKFPLKFKAFKSVINKPGALSNSGYMPVNSPIPSVTLGDTWYGIEYDLNLGSAGALAGSMGMIAGILVAWNPEQEGLYLGLKLPGSTGGKKEITVQGLLKIAFKSIRFEAYKDADGNGGYLLKLKNIVIKFMVVSFPPSGKTEITLFGDPRSPEEVPLRKDRLLGWYASYIKK